MDMSDISLDYMVTCYLHIQERYIATILMKMFIYIYIYTEQQKKRIFCIFGIVYKFGF